MLVGNRCLGKIINLACPPIEVLADRHPHNCSRMALNDTLSLEALWHKTASLNHRQLLLETIETVFKDAIEARAPKMRPPGKAGLRAEKGYYRLLYLEGEFKNAFSRPPSADSEKTGLSWDQMNTILGQLADIPELQSEITSAIARALVHIQARASGGG